MSESPLTSDDFPEEEPDQASAEATGLADELPEDADDAADGPELTGDAETAEEEPELPRLDPVEEFRNELMLLPGDWYVVHTYAGYEKRVKANVESRTQSLNMEDYIFQVEVPTEEVTEIKNGQRKMVQRKVLPGYILVRMDLNDQSWSAVRNTPGVTGFVGATSKPSPLTIDDVLKFLAPQVEEKKPEAKTDKAAQTLQREEAAKDDEPAEGEAQQMQTLQEDLGSTADELSVLSGPAERALTRSPCGPSSWARYSTARSRAALHRPIRL